MDADDGDTSSQPDEYARDNHLSIDSQIDLFSLVYQINHSVPLLTPDAGPSGLTCDSSLPPLQFPTVDLTERLDMTQECSDLVVKALQDDDTKVNDLCDAPLAQYEARKRLSKLKFDPPALCSDPDYDCRELSRAIHEQRQPNISSEMFPLERLNIANDEGLEFPVSSHQSRQKFDYIVRGEKLDVPKETIHHLACALRDDWSSNEQRRILEEAMPYRTLVRDLAVTPPLSPWTEHEDYFIPDAEVCEVPIASDLSSMLSDDLKASESAILQKEFDKDTASILDDGTPVLSPLLDLPEIGREMPKISSFRIESPLLPALSPPGPTHEEPTDIPALLRSMDTDHVLSHSKFSEMGVSKTDSTTGIFDQNLEDAMKESAAAVLKSIEQEHISIADAVARVEVPVMDFSIPEPEWQSLPMDARAHLKWVYDSHNIVLPPCPRDPQADSKLRWVPFLQKLDMHNLTKEVIDCGSNTSQSVIFPEEKEVPTSADYVWKRPGLSILREVESEEEAESMTPLRDVKPDLETLARKRRFENGIVELGTSFSPSSDESVDLVVPSPGRRPLRQTSAKNLIGNTELLPSMESNSTVSTLLSSYLDIRTAKRRKQDKSLFFSPTYVPQVERELRLAPKPPQSKGDSPSLCQRKEFLQKRLILPAPCPVIKVSTTPTKLIKGLTLSRGLFSMLEQLYPVAEIIERDFSRWNTASQNHYPASRSTTISSFAAEADVIVSPATGIIVTTLLKAIQQPLSTVGGQSSIRERIACTASRYERLIVLVSEGNAVDESVRDFTPAETSAYAEFIVFVTGLDSHIEVVYVGGGETTLAKWLVSFAVRYAPEATETQEYLLQDETKWEVFLRRAGFNAYAAQAILIRLRARDNDGEDESGRATYGLAAFMAMTDAQRVKNFRNLMGGERVLNDVNRMLRAMWS
ncbi:hypothetical protein F5Y09DRAFT_357767 [Xylaria sp. FL1042]|nr:hypothetical protein F5Y09DRAFT_357767 [Xylaria sp. FL1042]